jgi:serine/threonine-protein kinase
MSQNRQIEGPDKSHGVVEHDQTVISRGGPLAIAPIADGLHPRELGRALEGQQLDHVMLEEFVGGGGMGAVFRAWDTDLHRTVAVKVLSNYQTDDSETERRFQMEGRSAARLDHPNIARVHYVGQDLGVRYIVFEYIEGANVRDLVNTAGPLAVADAVNYTLQIAGALLHAFQREVVHRDIKPSNILITPDGLAKLVDMGLARYEAPEHGAHDETETGVTLGTFDYIAPEQAKNPRDADTRSDIYSLGCTLFYMLAGRPPFPHGTALQKVLAHAGDAAPGVREFRPDVSGELAAILAKMLAKRPEDRFTDPAELVAVLARELDSLGGIGPHYASLLAVPSLGMESSWLRRHAAWPISVVLLALTVFALAIWWSSGVESPEFPPLRTSGEPPAATSNE